MSPMECSNCRGTGGLKGKLCGRCSGSGIQPEPEPAASPLATVAYELWLELDRQRSRDARVMSPALRRLQERLGKVLAETLTVEERVEILGELKRGAENA